MLLKIIFLSAAILGISQGGVTKGRYEAFKKRGLEARNPYLMGGDVVRNRIYQSMVSVRYDSQHVCGGVILTENWILTAAQCIEKRSPSSITAVVGSNDLYNGDKHTVDKMIVHQYYDPADSWKNDIALLRVKEPITFTWDILPAELPVKGDTVPSGSVGSVIGWGSLEAGGELSGDLRSLDVTVTYNSECNDAYNPFNLHIYNDQFCAGGVSSRGTCDGDMGGPFIIDGKVTGIVSWGRPCGYKGYPTVYTKISQYIDWINDNIKNI